ncbi:LPP20 family lipoprotein [Rickettsiales bacterium]|nr:LPP20 family lipoprotein [Rickettsiales bacterium]
MKNIFIIKLIAIVFLMTSCSALDKKEVKDKPEVTGQNINLPDWVLDPKIETGIAAVGIAAPSRGGYRFQIPKAEADAKANIAGILQSEISRVTKNALRESKLNDVNDVEEFFSQATKDVIKNVKLAGVERMNMYKSDDGSLFIRMAIRENNYAKALKDSQALFSQVIANSNMSQSNIDQSQEAVQDMFDELENERQK